jgi:hypothetical protein
MRVCCCFVCDSTHIKLLFALLMSGWCFLLKKMYLYFCWTGPWLGRLFVAIFNKNLLPYPSSCNLSAIPQSGDANILTTLSLSFCFCSVAVTHVVWCSSMLLQRQLLDVCLVFMPPVWPLGSCHWMPSCYI